MFDTAQYRRKEVEIQRIDSIMRMLPLMRNRCWKPGAGTVISP